MAVEGGGAGGAHGRAAVPREVLGEIRRPARAMSAQFPLPSVFLSLYLVLAFFILFRLWTVTFSLREHRRQRVMSYRTFFNAICLVWTTLRFVFWLLLRVSADDNISPDLLAYTLFWLPHALEVRVGRWGVV